ncbi:MAG: hypothetical protein KA116_08060 [Proteobacteria bacterium]|nr:hypothetical protein [Pseudomonadota bacterium]
MRIKLFCIAVALCGIVHSYAEEMQGFVGIGYSPAIQFDGPDAGLRQTARLDFIRIPKNFGLELRASKNSDYQDLGALLKIFKVWNLNSQTATGIHAGIGLGANFSDKYQNTDLNQRERGTEGFLHGYSRFLWDFGNSVGLAFDLAYEYSPFLKINSYSKNFNPSTQRFIFGVMLAVDVD